MNAYRFDLVVDTDAEMSDELLVELCLELRASFNSFLKAKRIRYNKLTGDIDVSKCKTGNAGKKNQTFTGNYEL